MDWNMLWTSLSTLRTWTIFVVLSGLLWRKSTVCAATAVKEFGFFPTAADEQLLSSLDQFELVYSSFPEDSDFTRHRNDNLNEINGAKQLRLEGKNTQIDLDLLLNRDLTRAGVRIRHFAKDGAFEELQRSRCHYQGVVRGVVQSTVSLNTCNGISGTIVAKEDHLVIKPLSKSHNQTQQLHVLYKVHPEGPIQDLRDLNSLLNISHVELLEASGSTSNTHHRRVRRDVASEVKYIELAIYCSSTMINRYGGANFAFVRMLDIVNEADVYFRQFNVHLVVTYVELWEDNEDRISISDNLHLTLENFYQHIKDSNITRRTRFDAAHLAMATNVDRPRPYYSTSRQNSICTEKAVSLTEEFNSDVASADLARGLAHNLYIYNDDFYNRGGKVCACEGSPNSCVMYQRPVDWKPEPPSGFSECSLEAFEYHLERGYYSCLFNVPTPEEIVSFGTCGNGILEFPETCDCGTPEECAGNLCCDSKTCELTLGSECYQGECCSSCQFLPADTMCRENATECDIPEMCTGSSGNCPDNIYLQDGTPCLENTGYCYNGLCPTRDTQCQDIWGQGSSSAENCLALNTFARFPIGYCGYIIGDTLTYLNCDSTSGSDAQQQCGMLHCKNTTLSFFPYGLTPRGNSFGEYCLSIWVSDLNEADIINPSDVADGTKCGEGKVCQDFDCVPIESLGFPPCPSPQNGTVCSGNGVCTNNGQCLCVDGWGGAACNETAGVSPNSTFPPPTPSVPPPYPTPSPNATFPNTTFPPPTPPPTPSIPPPYPTPSPNATSPNTTIPPPPPSIPPPFPTPSPNATSPNATFPPPPPSIPPPFPTPSPNATSPNTTFPPPPPSIPPPFPTPSPNATSPNTTFPPPPPSILPPFPTPSPNVTFPPPPPSIPPPFPTPSPNATSPNTTFPPPPPSIPPPFPTPSPNATSPNTTFPPPPPSIPPPFPTPSPYATTPTPPTSISPPSPTPPDSNATVTPPPPPITPPFPTPVNNGTQQPSTQPPSTQPPTTQPPSTPSPGYIMANLNVTILDSQNNPLYGTSVRVSVAGGTCTSKDLIVPEMTNIVDIMRFIPGDGSLGVVVGKKGYTSNAVRWSSGITEDLVVRLLQLQPATVEVEGTNMLIESGFNSFGQKATIQFDTSLVDGATIDAFYALTSNTKVIPETEANSNGATVELVALGALELTISDKESGDVVSLDGGIEMLVPLDPGLDVKDGNEISIWTYNETTAFWEEAGVGKILITGDLLAYWQFTAPHLSWWMAADKLDKSTPKPPGTTLKPISPVIGLQMRTQIILFGSIGALIVLLLVIFITIVCCSCRKTRRNEKAMTGTLPVEETEMHPQTFSNKGLVSDDVAIEVNENVDTMAMMEQPDNQTSADIQFSTFQSS